MAGSGKKVNPYIAFMKTELVKLKKSNPGLEQKEYMKMAAKNWEKQKNNSHSKEVNKKTSTTKKESRSKSMTHKLHEVGGAKKKKRSTVKTSVVKKSSGSKRSKPKSKPKSKK